jgi:hypothetical protein
VDGLQPTAQVRPNWRFVAFVFVIVLIRAAVVASADSLLWIIAVCVSTPVAVVFVLIFLRRRIRNRVEHSPIVVLRPMPSPPQQVVQVVQPKAPEPPQPAKPRVDYSVDIGAHSPMPGEVPVYGQPMPYSYPPPQMQPQPYYPGAPPPLSGYMSDVPYAYGPQAPTPLPPPPAEYSGQPQPLPAAPAPPVPEYAGRYVS